MAKRSKYVKPAEPHILRARVVASKQVSPNFIRVAVGGDDLNRFVPMGHDQWFRMFIKRPGQTELRLPTQTSKLWYAQYLMMGKDTRPTVRNYTVRDFRPAGAGLFGTGPEMDIDFVVHGDSSPASAFATHAAPGEELAMLDEGLIYNPLPEAPWQLLVGDESALPAILGVLRSAPPDMKGNAFIEIPHSDDAQEVDAPEGVEVHWLTRSDPHALPGQFALQTVTATTLPDEPGYAFVVGEQQLATSLRRHLVTERKWPKENVSFTGFWRVGKAAG